MLLSKKVDDSKAAELIEALKKTVALDLCQQINIDTTQRKSKTNNKGASGYRHPLHL